MDFLNQFKGCSECKSKKDFIDKQGKVDCKTIKYKEDSDRNIYFSPIGNYFNFGLFNNRVTPDIVIMGITTSPTARDNFYSSMKELLKGNSFASAFKKACILNIFNSKNKNLQNRLSTILNISKVWKIIGIENNIDINNSFFEDYVNSDKNKEVLEKVFFTQYILCCSCDKKGTSKAPKRNDIQEEHLNCINFHEKLFESFNTKVKLLITFGKIHDFPGFKKLLKLKKVESHVNISHPASAFGWNELSIMDNNENDFKNMLLEIEIKRSNAGKHNKCYITQIENCYKQIKDIKNSVESIVEEQI